MTDTRITEADLRAAMRDPRYWQAGHPERESYARWVTDGWDALEHKGQGQGGQRSVQVRGYQRTRNGRQENVGSYTQLRSGGQGQGRQGNDTRTQPQREAPQERLAATALPPVAAPAAQAVGQAPRHDPARTRVLFVGGLFDSRTGIVPDFMRDFEDDLGIRRRDYFTHDEQDRLLATINDTPSDTRIILIGHSWGGDTAAQVAAHQGSIGRPVDMLVTADPVGRGLSEDFMRRVRQGATEWINVRPVGGSPFSPDNLIARIGSRYADLPAAFASNHVESNTSHENFRAMLRSTPFDNTRTVWQRILE